MLRRMAVPGGLTIRGICVVSYLAEKPSITVPSLRGRIMVKNPNLTSLELDLSHTRLISQFNSAVTLPLFIPNLLSLSPSIFLFSAAGMRFRLDCVDGDGGEPWMSSPGARRRRQDMDDGRPRHDGHGVNPVRVRWVQVPREDDGPLQ